MKKRGITVKDMLEWLIVFPFVAVAAPYVHYLKRKAGKGEDR